MTTPFPAEAAWPSITEWVRSVQRMLGLVPDGIWGPKTIAAARRADPILAGFARPSQVLVSSSGRIIPAYTPSFVSAMKRGFFFGIDLGDLQPSFVSRLVARESGFNFLATSPTGFVGLFQLGRSALQDIGYDTSHFDWYNPYWNAVAGVAYLRSLAAKLGRTVGVSNVNLYGSYNLGFSAYHSLVRGELKNRALVKALLANGASADTYRSEIERYFS